MAQTKKGKNQSNGQRSALIAAPLATDTTFLRRLLDEAGVKTFAADELTQSAASLRDMVRDAVERSDMVFVVLPKQASPGNVLVELGFALASGKPTLIIADKAAALPDLAAEVPCLRTDGRNGEALRFGLRQFLAIPRTKRKPAAPAARLTKPLGPKADALLAELRQLPDRPSNLAGLDDLIVKAVRASGVQALSQGKEIDATTTDVAVWSDDLYPLIQNPLLIQVKRRTLAGKSELNGIADRFRRAYGHENSEENLGWGLVIYRHAAPDADLAKAKNDFPKILFISAAEFLSSLREASFAELMFRLRNARVQGRG